jgi:hypothetical protein
VRQVSRNIDDITEELRSVMKKKLTFGVELPIVLARKMMTVLQQRGENAGRQI